MFVSVIFLSIIRVVLRSCAGLALKSSSGVPFTVVYDDSSHITARALQVYDLDIVACRTCQADYKP